jgi:hypothetical protein
LHLRRHLVMVLMELIDTTCGKASTFRMDVR